MGEAPESPLEPYWRSEDGDVVLYLGDCLDVLAAMEADSVDAVVTDPPAGVSFMGRSWDADRGGRDRWVGWLADRMEAAARVLKPGGHALVWSLPRTSHWTAWALEDAGLEIRDCILHLFGSGFPKSLDVAKAVDKVGGVSPKVQGAVLRAARERAGMTRAEVAALVGCKEASISDWEDGRARAVGRAVEYITPSPQYRDALADLLGYTADERRTVGASPDRRGDGSVIGLGHSGVLYAADAATDAAKPWEGFGTALKPGQEMWWLARKPIKGTVAANVLQFGTGALNIDACKVGTEQRVNNAGGMGSLQNVSRVEHGYREHVVMPSGEASEVTGRWPTNIVFTHSAACEPIGLHEVRSDGHHPAARGPGGLGTSGHAGQDDLSERKSGTEEVEVWACAPDCPVAELDRQSGVLTSGANPERRRSDNLRDAYGEFAGQETCVPHRGADSGGASRFYPTFRYQAKAPSSERPRLEDGTAHETVKPLGLISWLVRLITPPGGTVLDMFAGSGPVAEACIVEGFSCVLIEQDPKSAELIRTRLSKPIQPAMLTVDDSAPAAPVRPVAASRPEPVPEAHPSLFDDLDGAA